MLLQFRFKNYRSFRDDTNIDLGASGISEYSFHTIDTGTEKVLPVATIYGANASGKSNLVDAFRFMSFYVTNSFMFGGETDKKSISRRRIKPNCFLLDKKSKAEPSEFEVYFTDESSRIYNYGFTIYNGVIVEEWLNYKTKTNKEYKKIFYRNNSNSILEMNGITEKYKNNLSISIEPEVLISSLGAKLKIPVLKKVRDWFDALFIADFGNYQLSSFLWNTLPDGFVESDEVRKKVVEYFSAFDPSIVQFRVEPVEEDDESDEERFNIYALHKMNDCNELASIPLRAESSGTLKMFSLYPLLLETLSSGSVLIVDELNARLHPLLVRVLVQTFLNPEKNPNHAQLIFTTHDAWLLDSDLFRRDEIWLTEKKMDGASILYSLADFKDEGGSKIRKDENYEKNYLLGKYGAIPNLSGFNIVGDEKNEL